MLSLHWLKTLKQYKLSNRDYCSYVGIVNELLKYKSITAKQHNLIVNMCNYNIKSRCFKPIDHIQDVFKVDRSNLHRFKIWWESQNSSPSEFKLKFNGKGGGSLVLGRELLNTFKIYDTGLQADFYKDTPFYDTLLDKDVYQIGVCYKKKGKITLKDLSSIIIFSDDSRVNVIHNNKVYETTTTNGVLVEVL